MADRSARAAANLRKNQRKPLNIVRGLEKAKTQFGKRRKRTSQTSWYHREDVEKNKGLASHARRAAITTTTLPSTKPDSPVELPIWTAGRNRNVRLAAILSVPKGSLDDPGLALLRNNQERNGTGTHWQPIAHVETLYSWDGQPRNKTVHD